VNPKVFKIIIHNKITYFMIISEAYTRKESKSVYFLAKRLCLYITILFVFLQKNKEPRLTKKN